MSSKKSLQKADVTHYAISEHYSEEEGVVTTKRLSPIINPRQQAAPMSPSWNSPWATSPLASIWQKTPDPAPVRQQRSFSFSVGSMDKLEIPSLSELELPYMNTYSQERLEDINGQKPRSRSKSSSAIFGLPNEMAPGMPAPPIIPEETSPYAADMPNIWSNDTPQTFLAHRRASTTPSYTPGWADYAEPDNYRAKKSYDYVDVAPHSNRRPSLPALRASSPVQYMTEGIETLRLDHNPADTLQNIDDYFENTEHRTKAWVEAGKNLQNQQNMTPDTIPWPMYVVEFKAGRRDFFYVLESSNIIKNGDLVIVEADRGKDLGKVICDSLMSMAEVQAYQIKYPDVLADATFQKEIQPKRIYRLATPSEVGLLVPKSQDENKAMTLCQTKIRQRKLPMEVVDAEYQWDRRKLTFYFVADRRVDFRELVRDLFKLYKTRIWMCAVHSIKSS